MIPAGAGDAAGIPYEATAAASQALHDDAYALIGWEGITRILKAAAPYMMAQGWDAAVASMRYEDGTPVEVALNTNPYRHTS